MSAEPVVWAAEPHTKVKHDLYRRYLGKWMPIMIQGAWKGDVTYAEGFSGPGVYLDGSPGSPVIAFNAIRENPALRRTAVKKNVRMLFVDSDARRTERLHIELTKASDPVQLERLPEFGIHVDVQTGKCEPRLEGLLEEHGAWHKPILAVLDTWGGSVPLDLVARIAKNPSSEVLITIQPQYFSRFAGSNDLTHGDRVFGSTEWREVAQQPPARKTRWVIEHYREAIARTGFSHVLDFELVDRHGASLYLVFGTSHDRGLQKMKEAMWEVDASTGTGYRDPRDPNQETLDIQDVPQTHALRRLIVAHLENQPERAATIQELREFAFYKTVYKAAQVMPEVQEMLRRGQLVTSARGSGGRYSDTVTPS